MLGLMRRHSRSIVIKLLYIGLILSFLIWGFSSYQGSNDRVAVSINGEDIAYQDYLKAYDNTVNYYKEMLKDAYNEELLLKLNLKKQVLDSLINQVLLIEEAGRLKLKVDKNEIAAKIQASPAFQKDGRFDTQTYRKVLSIYHLKPSEYEEEQRSQILTSKAEEVIKKGAAISEEEALESYKKEKTQVNLEFVKITPGDLKKKSKATEAEVQDYFSSHLGDFTIPEKIDLGYAIFDPQSFIKEINLTKEDYEDYYKSFIEDFTTPGKVRASHILVKFEVDQSKDAARAKAEDILKKVTAGEDFTKLAKEFSDDTASAKKGGDLGFFGAGEMVEPFEDTAFSLEKEEVSDLVETNFGFHIIKVIDIVEDEVKALAEVKGEIRKNLEAEISAELAEGRAEDIYYEALKGKSLEELAKEEKLPYKTTDFFNLSNIPSAIAELKELVQTASTMDQGWMGRPIEAGSKLYILTLLGKQEPREPTLDEVKKEVKEAVAMEKAKKEALNLAEKILAQVQKGTKLTKLAKQNRLKTDETGDFSQTSNFVPKIGVSQDIVEKAFTLTTDKPLADTVFKVGDDVVILRLKERQEIDMETFEKEKDLFKEKILSQRREEVFKKWLEEARGKAELSYHEDLEELRG